MPDLCFRLMPVVREMWADPEGNEGAAYVAGVARDVRLPAYFRAMEQATTAPDETTALARYWAVYDPDAQMILRAGLLRLRRDRRLTKEERKTVLAMLKLENLAVYDGS